MSISDDMPLECSLAQAILWITQKRAPVDEKEFQALDVRHIVNTLGESRITDAINVMVAASWKGELLLTFSRLSVIRELVNDNPVLWELRKPRIWYSVRDSADITPWHIEYYQTPQEVAWFEGSELMDNECPEKITSVGVDWYANAIDLPNGIEGVNGHKLPPKGYAPQFRHWFRMSGCMVNVAGLMQISSGSTSSPTLNKRQQRNAAIMNLIGKFVEEYGGLPRKERFSVIEYVNETLDPPIEKRRGYQILSELYDSGKYKFYDLCNEKVQ